jgi:hypothetical protein
MTAVTGGPWRRGRSREGRTCAGAGTAATSGVRPGGTAGPRPAGAPRRSPCSRPSRPPRRPRRSSPPPPAEPAPPAVEVVDLRRRYGDFEAVRGVSFDVRPRRGLRAARRERRRQDLRARGARGPGSRVGRVGAVLGHDPARAGRRPPAPTGRPCCVALVSGLVAVGAAPAITGRRRDPPVRG